MPTIPGSKSTNIINSCHAQNDAHNATLFRSTLEQITSTLSALKVDFEGRELPVSLLPTIVHEEDLQKIEPPIRAIRRFLNRVIDVFCSEHASGAHAKPLHLFFKPYEKWWDIIASEKRRLPNINLMRYDAVLEATGAWSLLETNTACPGGIIHCSRLRESWLNTPLGKHFRERLNIIEYPTDRSWSFVRFLHKQALKISRGAPPNIALCIHKGMYMNELESLQQEHDILVKEGMLDGGSLFIFDICELECSSDHSTASYRNVPIHLIYNKFDPLSIDPSNAGITGWLNASKSTHVDFLNSLGAFYLTETKRILALLCDPDLRTYVRSTDEISRYLSHIPYTALLSLWSGQGGPNREALRIAARQKDEFVLKADALTRGQGVYLGNALSDAEWRNALAETKRNNGVMQKKIATPTKEGICVTPENTFFHTREYFGIDLFLFGDSFAGPVSRAHISPIFNIGSGGKESPTIVVRDTLH
jgi:diaminobutyrate-2-oxoglutarate transaminase